MADKRIVDLTALGATPATGDLFEMVDISDTTDDPSGTSKKVAFSNMTELVNDTSPQLGANLDLNSFKISGTGSIGFTANANVFIDVDGAGSVSYIDINNTNTGTVAYRFVDTGSARWIFGSDGADSDKMKYGASSSFGAADVLEMDRTDRSVNFIKTAGFNEEVDNGNSGTADTIDWRAGNKQKSTLTGNVTYTFTAPTSISAASLILRLIQDGTGSRTATFPASVHWSGGTAPTLSTAAGAVDIIAFYWDGTNFHGSFILDSQ